MRLRSLHSVVVFVLALGLAGCGRSESYRYKLTLAVNMPDGVKRSSSVTGWDFWEVSIPARGTPHRIRGQALYLDLGPGARPLIALLTSHLHEKKHIGVVWDWDGASLFSGFHGLETSFGNGDALLDWAARLSHMRGPATITPADLPDLVTFADINDPNSVIEVDPNDLQATLGPNITWNELTIDMTDEPVTKGIELKLPWIPYYWCGMLDGARYKDKRTLANTLSTADFDQSEESSERIKEKLRGNIESECQKSRTEWLSKR
ncbi:hypothetical protein [Bradyrhizobium genosp. A]|uniref:hypothetical protein n=1 Tax=Bradyrhizobium genosp. A TaxID=83626 RepID=UPI003CF65558